LRLVSVYACCVLWISRSSAFASSFSCKTAATQHENETRRRGGTAMMSVRARVPCPQSPTGAGSSALRQPSGPAPSSSAPGRAALRSCPDPRASFTHRTTLARHTRRSTHDAQRTTHDTRRTTHDTNVRLGPYLFAVLSLDVLGKEVRCLVVMPQ
jgi:hypothetical protein